jgi:hypothetical protein
VSCAVAASVLKLVTSAGTAGIRMLRVSGPTADCAISSASNGVAAAAARCLICDGEVWSSKVSS